MGLHLLFFVMLNIRQHSFKLKFTLAFGIVAKLNQVVIVSVVLTLRHHKTKMLSLQHSRLSAQVLYFSFQAIRGPTISASRCDKRLQTCTADF